MTPIDRTQKQRSLLERMLVPRATPMLAGFETTLFSGLTAIGGFLRSAIIAASFGASRMSDIYYAASNLLAQPTTIAIGALNTPVIPLLHAAEHPREESGRIIRTQMVIVGAITLLLAMLALPLIRMVFAGLHSDARRDIGKLFYILLPTLPVLVIGGFIDSTMKSKRIVIVGNSGRLAATWLAVAFLPLLIALGPNGVGLAYLIAQILSLLLVFVFVRKQLSFSCSDDRWFDSQYFRRVRPLLLAGIIGLVPIYFERYILSSLGEGSITVVSMAFSMIGMTSRVFVTSVMTSFYPYISLAVSQRDRAAFDRHIRTIRQFAIAVFGFLAIVGTVIAPYVFHFIYGRGQFTAENVSLLSDVFGVYLVRALAAALLQPVLYTYYANQDTKTPVLTSVGTYVLLTIVLNIILVSHLGVFTIPTVAGIAFSANLVVDTIVVRRRHSWVVYSFRDMIAVAFTIVAICIATFVGPMIGAAIALLHLLVVGRLSYGLSVAALRRVIKPPGHKVENVHVTREDMDTPNGDNTP